MAMRPIVDGLERELGDRVQVIRLNALDAASLEIAHSLGFRFTPSYAIFDREGNEVWRSQGRIDREEALQVVEPLLSSP